jgi:NTE family protein
MDIALPPSFEAAYGQGADRSICLGGGGIFFVAWQVGYLTALMDAGIDVRNADRVIGTSAGSMVATVLARDGLRRLHAELDAMTRFPQLAAHMSASGGMHPSQARAWSVFETTSTNDPEQLQRVGHAALAAQTVEAATMHRNIELIAGSGDWPGESVHITCIDTFSGERCVVDHRAAVPPSAAMAASTALPGMFPPQQVQDRKCMDGGVGASAVHLDLVAGSRFALVLSLRGFASTGTTQQDAADLQALKDSGTKVFTAVPESFTDKQMMDPDSIPTARDMGKGQGMADASAVAELWT